MSIFFIIIRTRFRWSSDIARAARAVWLLASSACIALILLVSVGLNASAADDVVLKKQIGEWSLYCTSDQKLSFQDCSIVTAAVAESDPSVWVKLALAFVSTSGEMEMTIRTPRLEYLKQGISISVDRGQIGRAFIDRCHEDYCQSTVAVEGQLRRRLGTSDFVTLEYQVGERSGVALRIPLGRLHLALGELGKVVDVKGPSVAGSSGPWKFSVVLRPNAFVGGFVADGWKDQVDDCFGIPAQKDVTVTNNKIENLQTFEQWATVAKLCKNRVVFWIIPDAKNAKPGALQEWGGYVVFDALVDRLKQEAGPADKPQVVFASPTGVPLALYPQ